MEKKPEKKNIIYNFSFTWYRYKKKKVFQDFFFCSFKLWTPTFYFFHNFHVSSLCIVNELKVKKQQDKESEKCIIAGTSPDRYTKKDTLVVK
jgi:hypothetical protein